MYIIDKYKDYYDYLSHIYGIDKKIVYDRRNSVVIDDEIICKEINSMTLYKKESYVILEVGFTQYLLKCFDVLFTEELYPKFISCNIEIVKVFRDNKHYFEKPMSISNVNVGFKWNWRTGKRISNFKDSYSELITHIGEVIENPILANTQITSLINPEEIWIDLQNYLSSLNNDKDIDLNLSDKEKSEIHGFDNKSFRNPIK